MYRTYAWAVSVTACVCALPYLIIHCYFELISEAYNYSAPIGERSIVKTVSVCLSVREHISGSSRPIFTQIFMPVARSSSGGVVISVSENASCKAVVFPDGL